MMLIALLTLASCSSEEDILELEYEKSTRSVDTLPPNPYVGSMLMQRMFLQIDLDEENTEDLRSCLQSIGTYYKRWYNCLIAVISEQPIARIYQKKMEIAASYSPVYNTIAVKDTPGNKEMPYIEELLHAGQDRVYAGGIEQYTDKGKPNIEFEASLTRDLIFYVGGGVYASGAGTDNVEEYQEWIEELCWSEVGGVNVFPSEERVLGLKLYFDKFQQMLGYYQMMELFKKRNSAYDKEILYTLGPEYIGFVYDSL
ncbi:MAG: hypothetical protein HDS03_10135 [Bacteroides sp.]|nr:hypothetical protein [Bacteroides sp.]